MLLYLKTPGAYYLNSGDLNTRRRFGKNLRSVKIPFSMGLFLLFVGCNAGGSERQKDEGLMPRLLGSIFLQAFLTSNESTYTVFKLSAIVGRL